MAGRFCARAGVLLALGAFVSWTPAFAASRNCTDPETVTADAALTSFSAPSNATQQAAAIANHLPWGEPVASSPRANEIPLIQPDYIARYDTNLKVPIWSAEKVVSANLTGGRVNCMRADPRLGAADASTQPDYAEPIYDLGHLTPSADQTDSVTSTINSFVLSNMTPQTCPFNEGIWQILEDLTRRWGTTRGTVYIINGSVFDRDHNGLRDPDSAAKRMHSNNGHERVAVPSDFYKIITYRRPDGALETLSIMMPNDFRMLAGPAAVTYLKNHITTVAKIERVTGLDFFPNLGTGLGESTTLWSFAGKPNPNLCRRPAVPRPGATASRRRHAA
jgi:DNA/RNA endonuclease G (NUC1)